jgi:two-component system nitrate/nitrite response regulator NarL
MKPSEGRIVVVDDHDLFAEAVALSLRVEGFEVSRLCLATCGDVLAAAFGERPSIALVDLDLGPFGDGSELIGPLTMSGIDVVLVTASRDRAEWGRCLHLGARAVVGKSGSLDAMVAVVRRLAQGLPAMPRAEREALMETWRRERAGSDGTRERFARLTRRERQVLGDLLAGLAVHDIAALDVVSEATVRTQVKSILAKLEVSSQLAAVVLAHRVGWHATPKQEAG